MPRPSREFGFGMMWKCTWSIAWCAPAPLFSSTLYSLIPVAATTARHSRGSTRPKAAADSSDSRSRVSAGSFGTTNVWPADSGLMSRNASTCSSSYTLLQGISPRTILPNTVSAMGRSSRGLESHCRSGWPHPGKPFYELDREAGKLPDPLRESAQIMGAGMKTKAAIAYAAGKPLEVVTVDLGGPKAGEVLVEIHASGVCHTDEFTRSGADPEGLFPVIFGHEGAGIVVDVGPGVTSVKKGDHVIPLYTPECRQCLSRKTNLCTAIRATQGKGVMPDGTSRFSIGSEMVHHYMGCSTFSNHTVLPEIALAKIRKDAPFDKVCY